MGVYTSQYQGRRRPLTWGQQTELAMIRSHIYTMQGVNELRRKPFQFRWV